MFGTPFETCSVRLPMLPAASYNRLFFMTGVVNAKAGVFACTKELLQAHGQVIDYVDRDYHHDYKIQVSIGGGSVCVHVC